MLEKKFQLEIATVRCCNTMACQRQLTISNKMIQFDGENGQYYGSLNCQSCKINNYFLWCECGSYLINKDNFYDGCFHECYNNTKCRKKFQIVKCPHCISYNLFENFSYQMGKVTCCHQCGGYFQQVACRGCYEDTYFDGNYKQAYPFSCSNKNCQKKGQQVQHVNCPSCLYPNLFNILMPMHNTVCQNVNCNKRFFYLNCQKCQDPIIEEGEERPEYGKNYECKKCKLFNCLYKCISCQKFSIKTSDKKGDYGRIVCNYQDCKKRQILLKCEKNTCKFLNHIEDKDNQNVIEHDCQGCKKKTFFMACPQCSSGYSLVQTDLANTKTVECQKCSSNIPHNINHNIQANSIECKICFEKQAIYLVDSCNHLFGCEDCAEGLKKTSGNTSRIKCPICRSLGAIKKIFF